MYKKKKKKLGDAPAELYYGRADDALIVARRQSGNRDVARTKRYTTIIIIKYNTCVCVYRTGIKDIYFFFFFPSLSRLILNRPADDIKPQTTKRKKSHLPYRSRMYLPVLHILLYTMLFGFPTKGTTRIENVRGLGEIDRNGDSLPPVRRFRTKP